MVKICSLGYGLVWNDLDEKIYAVYNGSFNYLEDIKISPLSRAYTFSDSVYEVIPFLISQQLLLEAYTQTQNSCNALEISINIDAVSSEITSLIKDSNLKMVIFIIKFQEV